MHILFHRTFFLGGFFMQPMPDIAALLKIAQSPAGQKLLAILQSRNPAGLDQIAATAATGNLEEAKQRLSSMLSDPETKELLKQLEKQL